MVILDGVDEWPEVPPEYRPGGNGLPSGKPDHDSGHGGEKPWKKHGNGRPWGSGHRRTEEDQN